MIERMTLSLVACSALTACVERRVWIDSTPSGALVWINDAQVGRTPVDVAITHEGVYDLRIEKDGYEPLVTPATTDGPLWDQFPLDFFAETMPVTARSETRWMFTLVVRDDSEATLVQRAGAMRDRVAAGAETVTVGEPTQGPEATTAPQVQPANPIPPQPTGG